MWKTLIYNGIKYENFLINEEGNVKNLKTNNIYNGTIHKSGYIILTLPLGKRGKVKSIRLHKALAENFIKNPNCYKVVHHKDGNKQNFKIENLEWTSQKQNILYHFEKESKKTEFFNNRKLTKKDIEFIRKNKDDFSLKEFSKMFNVSKTTISNVIKNISYKNE